MKLNDKVKDNTQQQMALDVIQRLTRVRTNNSFVQMHNTVAQKPIVNNGFVADIQTNRRSALIFNEKSF